MAVYGVWSIDYGLFPLKASSVQGMVYRVWCVVYRLWTISVESQWCTGYGVWCIDYGLFTLKASSVQCMVYCA